jgi:hypothetical protein
MMEQTSEKSENEDRNNGKFHSWEVSPDASF